MPEIRMAATSDTMVSGMLYEMATGNRYASMPMKCIDQMPMPPSATAAQATRARLGLPSALTMRPAQISATSDPANEMRNESATSPKEYSGDSNWPTTRGVMRFSFQRERAGGPENRM